MSKIHNDKLRMPLILPKGLEHEWLNKNLNEQDINDLMKPLSDGELESRTISKLITNKNKNQDTSEVQLAFEYPELAFLDGMDWGIINNLNNSIKK